MEDHSIFRLYYSKLREGEPYLPNIDRVDIGFLNSIKNSLGYSSFRFQVYMGRLFRVIGKESGFTKMIERLISLLNYLNLTLSITKHDLSS
jgi:hypothetical protein